MPGWFGCGSDYCRKTATIRYDWINFMEDLNELPIPLTWLVRVDDGPVYDIMLKQFKPRLATLKSRHEIGIHIHTYDWRGEWIQTKDPVKESEVVHKSVQRFRDILDFTPSSCRMGWNTMSNHIMAALVEEGIKVDASAIPNYLSNGRYDRRDNIINWRGAPSHPYHPSRDDYRREGDMEIVEVPIATIPKQAKDGFEKMWDKVFGNKLGRLMLPLKPGVSDLLMRMGFTTHTYLCLSPSWLIPKGQWKRTLKIIENQKMFMVGFFHGADVFDPRTEKQNFKFLNKMRELVDYLKSKNKEFLTLSEAAKLIEKEYI